MIVTGVIGCRAEAQTDDEKWGGKSSVSSNRSNRSLTADYGLSSGLLLKDALCGSDPTTAGTLDERVALFSSIENYADSDRQTPADTV
jgi:hypothetical protein